MRLFFHSIYCASLACLSTGVLAAQETRALPLLAGPELSLPIIAAPPTSLTALMPLMVDGIFAGDLGRAAGASALDQARGGTDTITNEARLSGFVTGNSASYVSTGANTIDGAAFANASGIPIVIQNSGANVLIQNATIINLQLR
ncbi:hypothetical protein AKG95_12570 [Janthinobacterium lividum]|uniref:Uncharacterized protein n=1 Tax=Janthinobacterium lividum TaxID=29581 RepID=A0A1S1U9P0_9BURK|nr:hypothetical protein AKG95_12570 [Janthinobacterium lividum]